MVSPRNQRHHHHTITTGSAFAHYTKSSRHKRMNSMLQSRRRIKWTTSSARRRTTYSSSKRTRPDPQQSRTFCSGKFIRPYFFFGNRWLLLLRLVVECFVWNGVCTLFCLGMFYYCVHLDMGSETISRLPCRSNRRPMCSTTISSSTRPWSDRRQLETTTSSAIISILPRVACARSCRRIRNSSPLSATQALGHSNKKNVKS